MSLLDRFFEPREAEIARLASAPERSINHQLSKLPVNIQGWIQDQLIVMPNVALDPDSYRRIVVVPMTFHPGDKQDEALPRRRNTGSWDCIVVASQDERYPVGGHRICVPEAQLVRGTIATIAEPVPSA